MRIVPNAVLAIVVAAVAGTIAFMSSANAEDTIPLDIKPTRVAEAIFAGGCFWCVESDFDKVDGVVDTLSGYTGDVSKPNPTYRDHGQHIEAVKVSYDPAVVSYEELVEYYWRHVDPTDAGGQFCDRGHAYETRIFATPGEQTEIAEASKAAIDASGVLGTPIVTPILEATTFWPAERYHQNYYKKNPVRYKYYRNACKRDQTIKKVWERESAAH